MNYKMLTGTLLASSLLLAACGGTEEKKEEKVTTEASTETRTTEAVSSEESNKNDSQAVKKSDGLDKPLTLDTVKVNLKDARTFNVKADQSMATMAKVNVGDMVQGVILNYEIENTADAPKNFYLDQAEILTNTGEQLSPQMLLTGGNFKAEMMGKVKSTLEIPYFFKTSKADEIENIKIEIPAVVNPDNFQNLSEPQTVTIDFK